MFTYLVDPLTTAFWSDEMFCKLIQEKNARFELSQNCVFRLEEAFDRGWGMQYFLMYRGVREVEIVFGANFEIQEDRPTLEHRFDEATQTNKYRFYIRNREFVSNEFFQAPKDVCLRPANYVSNPSVRLGWEYAENDDPLNPELHIFEVRGAEKPLLCALTGPFLSPPKELWSLKPPIVIQKHETYLVISPNIHLKRTLWYQNRSTTEGVQTAEEAAWISSDVRRRGVLAV